MCVTNCRDHSVHVGSALFLLSAPFYNLLHSRYSINYTLVSWEWIQIGKTHFTRKTTFFAGRSFHCLCHFSLSYPWMSCHVSLGTLMTSAASYRNVKCSNNKNVRGQATLLTAGAWCGGGWSVHISFLMPSNCALHPDYTNHLGNEETLFSS